MGRLVRASIGAAVVLSVAVAISGCTDRPVDDTMPVPTPTTSGSASPSPAPGQGPASPADSAKQQFDAAIGALLDTNADPGGRAVVDALVAAGFDKAALEVTPDKTAIGLDADNIQFSVNLGAECVVGQSGNVGYHSLILPVLDTGTCLVGTTRAIDW